MSALVGEKFRFKINTLSYEELGNLIKEAKEDKAAVRRAVDLSREYSNAWFPLDDRLRRLPQGNRLRIEKDRD